LRVVLHSNARPDNMERAKTLAANILPDVEHIDPGLAALCFGVLAAVAAHDGEWERFDECVRVLAQSRPDQGIVDADGAWIFEIIGNHAHAQDDDERAAFAYENALILWRALGRKDRVDGVGKVLGQLVTMPRLRRRTGDPLSD